MQFNSGSEDLYHHTTRFAVQNPFFAPSSFNEMVPWTPEKLLEFIQHDETTWSFEEYASNETHTTELIFHDDISYRGPASLTSARVVPVPGSVWLLGFKLAGLVSFRQKKKV
jgi:hypothetical protein